MSVARKALLAGVIIALLGAGLPVTGAAASLTGALSGKKKNCSATSPTKRQKVFYRHINHLRSTRGRNRVKTDQALQSAATAAAKSTPTRQQAHKLRTTSRTTLRKQFNKVGFLIRSGKSFKTVWHGLKRTRWERRVILRRAYKHDGVGVARDNGRAYVAIALGGKRITPASC
jgi:hypothetical protein